MSGPEYVRISAGENTYGQTNLLQAQLELLNTVKLLRGYRKLRMEDLRLKIELKSKIEEAHALLEKLNKLMPRTEYMLSQAQETPKKIKKAPEELSIEDEIDLIQAKLRVLQSED